ncbi:MAG TPA: hypothetical protein VMU95_41095 [Trebonia sp.]|nr:hypothetical protein [Trebonia sp.]
MTTPVVRYRLWVRVVLACWERMKAIGRYWLEAPDDDPYGDDGEDTRD